MAHAFISTMYLKYTVLYSKERINCNIGNLLRIRTHYTWIRTHYIPMDPDPDSGPDPVFPKKYSEAYRMPHFAKNVKLA
jgi:hypothetical protein